MMPGTSPLDDKQSFMTNEKTLIYIEGTNPSLGGTIVLSGDLLTESEELRKIKNFLREALKLARNIFLERTFLSQINSKIPKFIISEAGIVNENESPFLITKKVANRTTLVVTKVIMKKGTGVEALQDFVNLVPSSQGKIKLS